MSGEVSKKPTGPISWNPGALLCVALALRFERRRLRKHILTYEREVEPEMT